MAKYQLSNKAIADLSSIWDYTYDTWSESQADKYYDLLIDGCKQIANNPTVGKRYSQITDGILGFHVAKHIIFYQVSSPKTVTVIRILHSSMDLKSRIDE